MIRNLCPANPKGSGDNRHVNAMCYSPPWNSVEADSSISTPIQSVRKSIPHVQFWGRTLIDCRPTQEELKGTGAIGLRQTKRSQSPRTHISIFNLKPCFFGQTTDRGIASMPGT